MRRVAADAAASARTFGAARRRAARRRRQAPSTVTRGRGPRSLRVAAGAAHANACGLSATAAPPPANFNCAGARAPGRTGRATASAGRPWALVTALGPAGLRLRRRYLRARRSYSGSDSDGPAAHLFSGSESFQTLDTYSNFKMPAVESGPEGGTKRGEVE